MCFTARLLSNRIPVTRAVVTRGLPVFPPAFLHSTLWRRAGLDVAYFTALKLWILATHQQKGKGFLLNPNLSLFPLPVISRERGEGKRRLEHESHRGVNPKGTPPLHTQRPWLGVILWSMARLGRGCFWRHHTPPFPSIWQECAPQIPCSEKGLSCLIQAVQLKEKQPQKASWQENQALTFRKTIEVLFFSFHFCFLIVFIAVLFCGYHF